MGGEQTVWNRAWHSLSPRFQSVPVLMPRFGRAAVAGRVNGKDFVGRDEDQARIHNQALPWAL